MNMARAHNRVLRGPAREGAARVHCMSRRKPSRDLAVCAILAAIVAGCFSPIEKPLRAQIDRSVAFALLRENPEAFVGRLVLLGGIIVRVENQKEKTVLEILEKRLDPWSKPYDEDASGGRFLVVCPEFLDPVIYREGRQVTVVGEVTGKEVRPLGEIDYQYPVVASKQIYLWPEYPQHLYYPFPIWYYWDTSRVPYHPWL